MFRLAAPDEALAEADDYINVSHLADVCIKSRLTLAEDDVWLAEVEMLLLLLVLDAAAAAAARLDVYASTYEVNPVHVGRVKLAVPLVENGPLRVRPRYIWVGRAAGGLTSSSASL